MNYDELIKHFENGDNIYFKKGEIDNWRLVTKKEQLFPIHDYTYQLIDAIEDVKINKIRSFIKEQQGEFTLWRRTWLKQRFKRSFRIY